MTCMLLNTVMDNREIRLRNLQHLRNRYKGVKEFAEAVGIDRSSISAMLTGSRPIGPKSARIVENAFNKPRGWMDFLHDDEEEEKLPEDIRNLALRLASQTPEQIDMLNALLKAAKIDAEVPTNVIAVNKEAMVVTDPIEKNLIEAYRSTDSRGHELLASAATIARSYGRQTFVASPEEGQQGNKNQK